MFGSTSSFGSPSPFGQNNANPFGSQTGGIFGSSTPGIGGQSSSPLSSTPAFGAASSPAFGTSTPGFGSQPSSFGGSSTFGQQSFGGFGSGTQTSPFGNSSQQSQPAFGSNTFGSTASFGASTQPSFGATNTPAFGSSTAPSFGSTSTPAFGSTPSPSFGSTGTAFGIGSTPAFGAAGAFGSANSTPAFGAPTTSAFGGTSTPSFGSNTAGGTPAFGGSATPSFSFNSSPAFGQSTSPFGSPGFGSVPIGTQGSFGAQATTPTFGGGAFGQSNVGGSRVSSYQATADPDTTSSGQTQGKFVSISAMEIYKNKSHEELRWEDYQRGDKGGPNAAGQSTSVLSSGVSTPVPNPFGSPQTFGQPATNLFSTSTPSTQTNSFTPTPSLFGNTGFGASTPALGSSTFGTTPTTTPLFGSTSSQTPSPFSTSAPSFASSSSIFGAVSSSATGSSSLFGPAQGQGQSLFGATTFGSQTSPQFPSSSPSLNIGSSLGQTSSLFGSSSSFTNAFNTTSGSGISNTSFVTSRQPGLSQSTPSQATPFQPSLPSQTNSLFNFSNAGHTQTGGSSPSIFGQNIGHSYGNNQSSAAVQPVAIANPFGTLPAVPHMSYANTGTSPSIQYGISSMPVVDKPTPVRVSSLLTSRHLSQRRIRLPARKYNPKNDGSRVAFFSEEEEEPSTPKADALFIPRENPRSLIIRPTDQRPRPSTKDASVLVSEDGTASVEKQHHLNGYVAKGSNGVANGNGVIKDHQDSIKFIHKLGNTNNTPNQNGDSCENGSDIGTAMPKLPHSDYYSEPQIQELAAKERAEPGYCRHVKDFVVGRHGFGSIKFLGETDVRGLDLETLIQFNDREVIVYMDDSNKPPVGQGLNKPAEVTLLNIKCYDKKTKNQISEGPKLDKYKEMLKKKAEDQGAEFLSYDPAKGEWKFRVKHFSRYGFCDSEQ